MADDKTNRGEPDRSRVAGGQDFEVDYLARKHGISEEQVRKLIREHGNDRAKVEAAISRLA